MKFKQLFSLPKWAKIILGVLSAIAVVGIIATLALNLSTKGEIYSANLILKSQKSLENSRQIAYHFWIDFPKFKPLLRSQTISRVEILRYAWNEHIDTNAIENLRAGGRNVWFNSTQDFSNFAESSAESTQNIPDSATQIAESTQKSIVSIEYKITFSPLLKIIAKYYALILALICVPFVLWQFFTHLWRSLPPKISIFAESSAESTQNIPDSANRAKIAESSLNLTKKDYAFLAFAFVLCVGFCTFSFWLGFPGFHIIGDTYNSIALAKNNAHPVFIAYILQGLYFVFGKHIYYLFLFNLVPFYAGIFLLIAGFYLRFKNPLALLLLFPTLIGNIYFQNFIQYHSFALPMMLFCIYSLILFFILVPLKRAKILWILLFVLMFFAILWRHNAIFSVFPAFFIICYLFLQNRGLDSAKFTKIYAKFIILSAILCLFIVLFIPKLLQTSQSHPANHPFLHQIAGACVPADDASCFKDEWYYPHKKWSDVKDLYAKYPLNADPFNVSWGYDSERPFKPEKLNGLQGAWIGAIFKYPSNFLAHEVRFFKAMWWQNPAWIFDAKQIQQKASHPWHISMVSGFTESERSVSFSPVKERIYTFLYNHKILLNHIWGIGVGFVVLIISSVILWRRRKAVFVDNACQNNALVFCFSVSFATFFSAVFIALFTPVPETRYMSPILPMAIIALVGFVAFVLEAINKSIYARVK